MTPVRCAHCNLPLYAADVAEGRAICPSCRSLNVVAAFPALAEGGTGKPPALPDDPPGEGEAACFYSPTRRATAVCSHCGLCMISNTWAAQWGTRAPFASKCLDHLRSQGNDGERFQGSRTLWDNIALLLAVAPCTLILWWSVFFTAPAALFIGLRHWNAPRSLVPRSRARMAIALILAFLQVVWAFMPSARCGLTFLGTEPFSEDLTHEEVLRQLPPPGRRGSRFARFALGRS